MNSCFLFGHRDAPFEIQPRIEEWVRNFYAERNVRYFYVGGYGAFDSMAASAVKAVKRKYPDIMLYLVIPYHPAERPVEVPFGFDGTFYPPLESVPRRYAIVRANRYMVENCSHILCYVKHIGNTRTLLEYAGRRMEKGLAYIENIAKDL